MEKQGLLAGESASSSFVTSPWFLEIWRASTDSFVSFEEVKRGPVPEPYASDIWECITALKKYAGVTMPYRLYLPSARIAHGEEATGEERDVFLYLSRELISSLSNIREQADLTSDSARSLLRLSASRRRLGFLAIDELAFCLKQDGVALESSRIHDLWARNLSARSEEEALFLAAIDLFVDTSRHSRRPVTRGLVETVWEELVSCASRMQLRNSPRVSAEDGFFVYESDEILGIICSLIGGRSGGIDPLVAVHDMCGLMWDQAPLPSLNYTVGAILRKIYLERCGFPVLAYTPYASAFDRWIHGWSDAEAGIQPYEATQDVRISSRGFDSTAFHASVLHINEVILQKIAAQLAGFDATAAVLHENLCADIRLNVRQRTLLSSLFDAPEQCVSIAGYAKQFDVSYTTARNELNLLADIHYLLRKECSKTVTFVPGSRLAEMGKSPSHNTDSIAQRRQHRTT